MRGFIALLAVAACGDGGPAPPDAYIPAEPASNPGRGIDKTALSFDLTAMTGRATIDFEGSDAPGATLEVGDLVIDSVSVPFQADPATKTIALGLGAGDYGRQVQIEFHWKHHPGFEGATAAGYTFLWPYHCGNLFPCHSQPRDGMATTLALTNVPAGKTAVYSFGFPEAPSYQVAWAIDDYTELPLGTTTAGTQVSVWYRTNELATAQQGTANLVAAFDWFEKTIGPYRFGTKVGTVSVKWGPGAYGGMEHHPFWHVGSASLGDQETNVHEAAHGWFGDGIRIACWEDFVLSEGTTTYLAGRALDVVAPSVGAQVWQSFASELASIPATALVWPQSCNTVDIIKDDLFTNAPYVRGAFFYRAVALKVGAAKLDEALRAFYTGFGSKAARMTDMIAAIKSITGYDATTCADMWLTSTTKPAAETPCP
ncbi:MAG: peptidase M1 [Myxococcales bacterium]|nr:peptidase M1 [Myxococcales bacterium]